MSAPPALPREITDKCVKLVRDMARGYFDLNGPRRAFAKEGQRAHAIETEIRAFLGGQNGQPE